MIAVIADDFTGAAEIGGIGLRRGLKVVIETKVNNPNGADLLIIAADTRSMRPADAVNEIEKITNDILKLKPEYIFKKLDSVLRGNIVEELKAQMKRMGKDKALVVAGNPHFNRIIKNGIYYVNGVPLADTFFANDPQYPISTSNVVEILKNDEKVQVVSLENDLNKDRIMMANVCCVGEMQKWSEKVNSSIMLAGGAGFFDVMLKKQYPNLDKTPANHYPLGEKTLFVFGSTFPKSEKLLSQLHSLGMYVSNMPEALFFKQADREKRIEKWTDEVVGELKNNKKVVITINHVSSEGIELSNRIRETIGLLVQNVVAQVEINDLLIEGGDTTSAILEHINVSKLIPYCELGHGVIQMKTEIYPAMCITTKPGSYFWPEEIILNGNGNEQTN